MIKKRIYSVQDCNLSYHIWFLAALWIFGLLFGIYYASKDNDTTQLLTSALQSQQSFFKLLFVLLLPIAASLLAISFSLRGAIYLLAAGKAFACGYCLFCVAATFGSGSWLVRLLFLFSDTCLSVLLLWLWCRHLGSKRKTLAKDTLVCTVIAISAGLIDFLLFSPFLRVLIKE